MTAHPEMKLLCHTQQLLSRDVVADYYIDACNQLVVIVVHPSCPVRDKMDAVSVDEASSPALAHRLLGYCRRKVLYHLSRRR
jgi:hypothetical protein